MIYTILRLRFNAAYFTENYKKKKKNQVTVH